ncbi:hypothetical protein [Dyadobacter sp. CY326]|uniref:hypothetical protein n=1 Tax=Dyadobacter sp. CY326 TaxID=2907300 RepID=UPI001F318D61|nr:hypothetical protein [Dyadobacter sp. CY326]MCE7066106.1 hypothetical protein [Dyadobacter sp. CY326]
MERKIALTFRQTTLKESNQTHEDLQYWSARTPKERLAAVTFLVNQQIGAEQRLNKTVVS